MTGNVTLTLTVPVIEALTYILTPNSIPIPTPALLTLALLTLHCGMAMQVDAVILVVRSLLAQGVNWEQLWLVIKDEQEKGNPLAGARVPRVPLEPRAG